MDIEQQEQPQKGPPNGAGGELLSGPTPAARAQAARTARRAATRAAIESDQLDDAAPAAKDEPAVKPRAKPSKPIEVVEPKADQVEDDDEGDLPDVKAKAEPAGDAPDAATARRLELVQAAEKRSRERLAAERKTFEAERAALEKERAELAERRADIEAYQKARERAKLDPVAALKALGVDDLEYAAKQAYAAHKGEPGNKEAAAKALREREQAERLDAVEKRIAEREKAEQEQARAAEVRQKTEAYMDGVTKAAAEIDDAPLVKHFLAKQPQKTKARLLQAAMELLDETGDIPDAADVIARVEKSRREELLELGVDPTKLSSPALSAETKTKDKQAVETSAARTLSNDLSSPREPRKKSSDRERRAETRRMLESGDLE
jgi:hypothetical protein